MTTRQPCPSCASGGVELIQEAARLAEKERDKRDLAHDFPIFGWAICPCGAVAIALASSRISLDNIPGGAGYCMAPNDAAVLFEAARTLGFV